MLTNTHIYNFCASGGTQGVQCFISHQSGSGDKFNLDPNSCVLSVANAVDRETMSIYQVIVELRDTGYANVRTNNAIFKVTLTDVNDNAPNFGTFASGLNLTIVENIAVGMLDDLNILFR